MSEPFGVFNEQLSTPARLAICVGFSAALSLASAGLLHLPKRMGSAGVRIRERLSRAPLLDVVMLWLTQGPPLLCVAWSLLSPSPRWEWMAALAAGVLGQIIALYAWCLLHEAANPRTSPRLVEVINRNLSTPRGEKPGPTSLVGRLRNHGALLWTLWAVPVLNVIRIAEYAVYPALVRVARLPRYDHAQWVNLSRHKVEGLVGHDLVWCLYCDWMTGVWSLASEMLRNVESFWCPIRFASPEKCANCSVDFPDIAGGWVPHSAPATAAAGLVERAYPAADGTNAWLGHPVRLTVQGKDQSQP